jgi:putative aldouronate transport system substrate-binding protein
MHRGVDIMKERGMGIKALCMALVLTLCLACAGFSVAASEDELMNISIFVSGETAGKELPALDFIRDKFGVNIDFQANSANSNDKLNILLASEDYPEGIIYQKDSIYSKFLQSGHVLPLDEYLEGAPNYKAAIEKYMPFYLDENDGKLYFLPYGFDEVAHLDNAFIVRLDLWEAIGKPEIKTNEDLGEAAKLMKEIMPEVNGKTAYPFGFFFGDTWGDEWYDKVAIAAMGQTMFQKCNLAVNGQRLTMVDYMLATEEFRDAMKFANRMYREGLADPQSAVAKASEYENALNDGKNFIGITTWSVLGINASLANAGHPEQVIEPLFLRWDGYEGKTFYANKWGAGSSISMWLTDKATEDQVKKVFEIADYMNTEEGAPLGWWGVKDVHYTVDDAGYMAFTQLGQDLVQGDSRWAQKMGAWLYTFGAPSGLNKVGQAYEFSKDAAYLSATYTDVEKQYAETLGYTAFDDPFVADFIGAECTALNAAFVLPDNSPEIAIKTKADTLCNQVTAQLFLAKSEEQFDEIYDKAIADLQAMGYDKFVKIYSDNLERIQDQMGI